jgi:hypothetical protein
MKPILNTAGYESSAVAVRSVSKPASKLYGDFYSHEDPVTRFKMFDEDAQSAGKGQMTSARKPDG